MAERREAREGLSEEGRWSRDQKSEVRPLRETCEGERSQVGRQWDSVRNREGQEELEEGSPESERNCGAGRRNRRRRPW